MALAAYNCGPNRVRKILKQTGKKTYWGIRHLLPRQTREFVPKLVAVKYLFDYYQRHDIQPIFPSIDLQLTQSIEIQAGKTYHDLGELTNLTGGVISFLNPSFIDEPKYADLGIIDLVVPSRVANAVLRHFEIEQKYQDILYTRDSSSINTPYHKVRYAVTDSMSLTQFCKNYNLSTSQIWLWNELHDYNLVPGQEIFTYSFQNLMLEYEMPTRELLDLKISRLNYPVSLTDTISNEIRKENRELVKGGFVAIALLP